MAFSLKRGLGSAALVRPAARVFSAEPSLRDLPDIAKVNYTDEFD